MRRLPDGWEWARFKDVATVEANLVDPADYPDYPHIAPNHIETRTGKLLPHTTVRDDGVTSSKHLFFPDRILYSKIRPYLAKVVRVDFSGLCSADMYPVSTELHTHFLHHWLLSTEFTALAAGEQGRSVLPKINRDALDKLPVPVPPIREQKRIVAAIEEHLSRLDAAVASTARAIYRVRCLGRQIIDAAMSLAGEFATLDSYAAPGGITDGPFGSKLKSSDYTLEGPRVVRLENIGFGDFIDEQTHISTEHFEELRKHEAVGGDIVVASLVSERLRACIVPMDLGPAIVKADCIRVRLSHGTDPRFVKYALMRSLLDDFVAENVRGVGRSRLGLTNVRRIPVPLADPDVQRRIADGLDEKLGVLACVKSQGDEALRRATALRRAILAAGFSGQLVPQDPGDEPASVLLERIRDQRAAATPTRRTRTQGALR
jgi:hypothetical protein